MKRLVLFAPNWLGDAVMAQPALADIRRALPGATIALATERPAIAAFAGLLGMIDEVVPLDGLKERRFEAAVLLPNSFHSAFVAARAGIPERWGYRTDWRGALLTRAVRRSPNVHQVDSFQILVAALGFATGSSEPRIDVSGDLRTRGADELQRAGWNGRDPLVALAPGAAYGGAKRWPVDSFAGLADGLMADAVRPVLVGGPADVEVGRAIASRAKASGLLNTIGNDVPALAGVLANCRALVSNDSGAMHLGAAIGVAVTALFGPTDETRTRPIGAHHRVLSHPVWCRPCMLRECPLDHACMRGIGVDEVVRSTRGMLRASY